jgi:hypothetical protein
MSSNCGTRLADSRNVIFPDIVNLKQFKEIMTRQWKETVISKDAVNNHQGKQELPTLPIPVVMKAGKILSENLLSKEQKRITVLEIMSGNCSGSRILFNTIAKMLTVDKWICTDIIDYASTKSIKEHKIEFYKLNGLEAVRKFTDVDILLLMCPPPNTVMYDNNVNPMALCDYYSVVEYIDFNIGKKGKQIVFIGELGGSSATEGMYHFMLTNEKIKLVHREMLVSGYNQFGIFEMEIFIFDIL